MTSSRRELIFERLSSLELEMKPLIKDKTFLPTLEEIELTDFVYYSTIIFAGVVTDAAFECKIKELMKMKGIVVDDASFKTIVILVKGFIEWMRNL